MSITYVDDMYFGLDCPAKNKAYRDIHIDLNKNSVASLRDIASCIGLKGYSKFKKAELLKFIRDSGFKVEKGSSKKSSKKSSSKKSSSK